MGVTLDTDQLCSITYYKLMLIYKLLHVLSTSFVHAAHMSCHAGGIGDRIGGEIGGGVGRKGGRIGCEIGGGVGRIGCRYHISYTSMGAIRHKYECFALLQITYVCMTMNIYRVYMSMFPTCIEYVIILYEYLLSMSSVCMSMSARMYEHV